VVPASASAWLYDPLRMPSLGPACQAWLAAGSKFPLLPCCNTRLTYGPSLQSNQRNSRRPTGQSDWRHGAHPKEEL
jgi:hypothetical protein